MTLRSRMNYVYKTYSLSHKTQSKSFFQCKSLLVEKVRLAMDSTNIFVSFDFHNTLMIYLRLQFDKENSFFCLEDKELHVVKRRCIWLSVNLCGTDFPTLLTFPSSCRRLSTVIGETLRSFASSRMLMLQYWSNGHSKSVLVSSLSLPDLGTSFKLILLSWENHCRT